MFDVSARSITSTAFCSLMTSSYPVDDGSMTRDERDAVLDKVRSSKTVNVILISFKAGSVGEFRRGISALWGIF